MLGTPVVVWLIWKNRGAYPSFPQVLNYLDRTDFAQKYLKETRNNDRIWKIRKRYEIRSEDNAVDVQIHD